MKQFQQEFIAFIIESEVLKFGDFQTKSGRKSPYFINSGNFDTGKKLSILGNYYAQAIQEFITNDFDLLYGPAYKGITLASSTSMALYQKYNKNFPFCFNRKEAKSHGEKGIFIGQEIQQNSTVLIIEDVITAGTSLQENLPLITQQKAQVLDVMVAVDRQEKSPENTSMKEFFKKKYNINLHSIVTISNIIDYIKQNKVNIGLNTDILQRIEDYKSEYIK